MVEETALILTPLPFVVADNVEVGVPLATPVMANCALSVEDPPILKS